MQDSSVGPESLDAYGVLTSTFRAPIPLEVEIFTKVQRVAHDNADFSLSEIKMVKECAIVTVKKITEAETVKEASESCFHLQFVCFPVIVME